MIRRQFLSVSAITGGLLFSGCLDSSRWDSSDSDDSNNNSNSESSNNDQNGPDKGRLVIRGYQNITHTIEVLVRDEADNIIYSNQFEREPEGDPYEMRPGADIGSTYHVEITTDDHQEEFEWQPTAEKHALYIYVEDSTVRFVPSSGEEKAGLVIYNHTNTTQTYELSIRDHTDYTIYSDSYEREPGDPIGVRPGADIGSTYYVEITTNDHQEEFEWQPTAEVSALYIYIEDSTVRFVPNRGEG